MTGQDHHTVAVDAAAAWERNRHLQYGGLVDDDRPSPRDLAEEAALLEDRERRDREAREAARARGEWVPTARMGLEAALTGLVLATRGLMVDVVPVRPWVYRLDSQARCCVTVDAVREALPERWEVVERDGAVWIRSTDEGGAA